ncbi:MAG: four helix bundle protein [Candidatus Omnitrophica bacterium]|nr:four helix bundle protein [Candidatus Omnitrophota bacterium]
METGFKKLLVWQKAYQLALNIYRELKAFPKEEQFGLISQMRRAILSVPANIAEGYERGSRKDYIHFLRIAKGSLSETETYLMFSRDLGYVTGSCYAELEKQRSETGRLLNGLIRSLSQGV